jgi:hypothetical protein
MHGDTVAAKLHALQMCQNQYVVRTNKGSSLLCGHSVCSLLRNTLSQFQPQNQFHMNRFQDAAITRTLDNHTQHRQNHSIDMRVCMDGKM